MKKPDQRLFAARSMRGNRLRVCGVITSMVLLLAAIALGMFSFIPSKASTYIASDAFNRTVSGGWGTANLGGSWTVLDTPANWSVKPGAGSINVAANGQERGVLGSITVQDVGLYARITLPRCSGSGTNCDAFVLGRYAPAYSPTYYRVGVVQGAGRSDMFLRAQRSDGASLGSDVDTGLPAANGAVVWLHVQFQGTNPTTIRARAWLNGTSEPSTWPLTTSDSNGAEQTAGKRGVAVAPIRECSTSPRVA